jgi:glycosyltransferase involved in cell wall biosynthesis
LRLLVVTPTYYGEDNVVGGAEEFVHSTVCALEKLSEVSSITVVFFSANKNSSQVSGKVKRFGYKTFHFGGNLSNPMPPLNLLFKKDYDILYLHQFNTWLTLLFAFFGKLFGKKVVLTDHNGGGVNYNRRLGVNKFIDINFHTSNISKEDARIEFKKNVRIFGGVNTSLYRPLGSVERKKDFLFVGRIHPIKGIDLLVSASQNLQKSHSLTLVLSTNSEADKRKVLKDVGDSSNISVVFNQTKEELVKLYNEHRWVCLPSKKALGRENLGLTILEGMACGAKGACSPNCGVKEMKEEYPTDDLVVVDNWERFFEEEAGKESKSNASEWINNYGTWPSVAKRILNGL